MHNGTYILHTTNLSISLRFLGVVTPDFSFDSSFPKDGAKKQKRKKANTLTSIFLYSKFSKT